MPGTSYLYCIYIDVLNEFKIIHWLCPHAAKKEMINENILVEFGEQDLSMLLLNYHTYTESMNF